MAASQGSVRPRDRAVAAFIARLRSIADSPEMVAIRSALPPSFIGLALGLLAFMAFAPGSLLARFSTSFAAAFGVMSALLLALLTWDLAGRRHMPRIAALAIAVTAFLLSLPYAKSSSFITLAKALGSSGLFLAIGVALVTVGALAFARHRAGPVIGTVLAASVVVGAAALLLWHGISLTSALDVAIAPLGTLGDSLTALLVITLVETLLWTVGIHGPALLAAVVLPVYLNLQVQNTEALARNAPLPHIVTVSTFLFVFPGGAGATLPLVLLLLRSKTVRLKRVALATLLPSLVNANEPLMFGLPLILNPILGIPFVVVPLVLATVSWEAIALGLVARPAYYVPSTIPIPFGVLVATKDWRSVLLVVVEVLLGLALYAPFVRIYERRERRRADAGPAA